MPKTRAPEAITKIPGSSRAQMADFPASFDTGNALSRDDVTYKVDDAENGDLSDNPDRDHDLLDDAANDGMIPDTPLEKPDTLKPEIDLPLHDLQEH